MPKSISLFLQAGCVFLVGYKVKILVKFIMLYWILSNEKKEFKAPYKILNIVIKW